MPGLDEDTADATTLPIDSHPSDKTNVFSQITALTCSTLGAAPHVVLAAAFVVLAIIGGILDGAGRVVGHAITGKYRPEFGAQSHDHGHDHAGFKGYVLAEGAGAPLTLEGLEPGCELRLSGP
jgi:hypothetical protein